MIENYASDSGKLVANASRRILVGLQSQRRQRRFTLRCCHPERREAESEDPAELREVMQRDLIRSLPVRSASGLPVHVAASPAAPFSTSLGMTRAYADGNLNPPCSSIGSKFLHKQETAAADPSVFGEKNSCRKVAQTVAMVGAVVT